MQLCRLSTWIGAATIGMFRVAMRGPGFEGSRGFRGADLFGAFGASQGAAADASAGSSPGPSGSSSMSGISSGGSDASPRDSLPRNSMRSMSRWGDGS